MKKSVILILVAIVFLSCLTLNKVSADLSMSSFDNYTIYLPNQATLATLVTSTYDNSSISYNWSKVSGPGSVTFSNQYYSVTDVTFSTSGDYVLRINASDGETSDSEDVNLTVFPEPISIKVKKSGTGTGNVSGTGINCGSDCSETYDEDTPISLTATPSDGSIFIGWVSSGCLGNSSNVCNVTVNGTKEVTAFFDTNTTGINVYYVSNDGDDSNNGSIDFPWLTIQHAADTAVAGDKVIVKAGIYHEFITFPNSGTEESPIVFEGERNAEGEWLTIVDPSTDVSSGWLAAPEIGDGVYKKDVGFTTRELTINNKRVARVHSMEDINDHINGVYYNTNWTNGSELLNVSADALVNHGGSLTRYWDGLEAFWAFSGNTTYLRLRNGSNPNGMNIRVTPEQYTFFISGESYLDFRNLNVRNSYIAFWIQLNSYENIYSHHITVESNNMSNGYARVWVYLGSYQNIIRNNEMVNSFYGFSDPGTNGGRDSPDYLWILRGYQYLVSKIIISNSWGCDDFGVFISYAGSNNIISGNHISKGLGTGIAIYGQPSSPVANTDIYDNVIENQPSIGVLDGFGNTYTKIHDNLFIDSNIHIRIHESGNPAQTNRTLFVYRNKFWLPKDSSDHIHVHFFGWDGTNQTLWAYHNTFVGGYGGFSNDAGGNQYVFNMNLLDNVFSGVFSAVYVGSEFQDNASLMGIFDYNFVAPPLYYALMPWYREHNINQSDPLWDYDEIPDFLLTNGSIAIDSGIDLSQPFTINGTEYPALPGMELGYFSGDAPDMGAVEYNGSEVIRLTALFGTNPTNNYDSDSQNITFDFKCSYNSTIDTIQLFTNTTGTWNANYSNNSYTNGTWLNITLEGIPEGTYKWAVYCNGTEGNSDWTNTNRTFSFTLEEEEEEQKKGGGGGGGGAEEDITNSTNQTNMTNVSQPILNNTNNLNNINETNESAGAGNQVTKPSTMANILKYWWIAVIAVVAIAVLIILGSIKKKESF